MKEDEKREFFRLDFPKLRKQYNIIIGPRRDRTKQQKEHVNGKEKR